MVSAFSQGKKWNEYYNNYEGISNISKNEIIEIAYLF